MDGNQHCFTPSSVYYTADAKGPKDNGKENAGPMMNEWVSGSIPLESHATISTVCEGTVQANSVKMLRNVEKTDNTYCSSTVTPKQYTETY